MDGYFLNIIKNTYTSVLKLALEVCLFGIETKQRWLPFILPEVLVNAIRQEKIIRSTSRGSSSVRAGAGS